jgi:hypothetical protein
MEAPMLLNVLIMVIMALCGVLMAIILYEIRQVRERLHKMEGQHGTILTHIEFLNKHLDAIKELYGRVNKLEIVTAKR